MSKKIIEGTVDISNLCLTQIPSFLKDVEVRGSFWCNINRLSSLEGAPKVVKGDFWCNYNQLTSLEGAPKIVEGDFWCYENTVKITEEQVRAVCDVKGNVYV